MPKYAVLNYVYDYSVKKRICTLLIMFGNKAKKNMQIHKLTMYTIQT